MPRLSRKPSAIRMRRHRLARRIKIITELGSRCVECGESDVTKLELDHKSPRENGWQNGRLWSTSRLKIYEREHAEGKLQLLCGECNRKKGKPAGESSRADYGSGF